MRLRVGWVKIKCEHTVVENSWDVLSLLMSDVDAAATRKRKEKIGGT